MEKEKTEENIGEIIRNFREKNEIKQIEFCKKIDNIISPSTLSLIERNKKELSKEAKEKIEESFSLLLPKTNNEYVEKLIQLRKENNLTQEELGKLFETSRWTISNLERKVRFFSAEDKEKIDKILENPEILFKFKRESENNRIDKKEEIFAPTLSLFSNNQEIKKPIFENKIENIFQFQEIIEMLEKIEQEIKNLVSKENVINYFKKIEIPKEEKKQTLEEILKIYYQN